MTSKPDANPFRGRPIAFLPRLFKLTQEERMRGAMGVPYWVHRRKRLEKKTENLRKDLERRWWITPPAAWADVAAGWDLSAVNREIERYNLYYPIERNLPMDPRSREMVDGDTRWIPRPPLDAAWILAEYPAEKAGLKR